MKQIYKRALARPDGHALVRLLMINDHKGETPMFNFDPESANSSWEEGQYDFVVEHTEESLTKANSDPMLKVKLKLYHPTGKDQILTDYFVAPPPSSGRKNNLFRLRALCAALGEEFVGTFGNGKVDHKAMRGKRGLATLSRENTEKYGDQNRIEAYAKLPDGYAAGRIEEDDDEVPF